MNNENTWLDKNPYNLLECTARKPLLMVIPSEGTTIPCPVHPEGHFITGPQHSFC
jgi:hypothetical protein